MGKNGHPAPPDQVPPQKPIPGTEGFPVQNPPDPPPPPPPDND